MKSIRGRALSRNTARMKASDEYSEHYFVVKKTHRTEAEMNKHRVALNSNQIIAI